MEAWKRAVFDLLNQSNRTAPTFLYIAVDLPGVGREGFFGKRIDPCGDLPLDLPGQGGQDLERLAGEIQVHAVFQGLQQHEMGGPSLVPAMVRRPNGRRTLGFSGTSIGMAELRGCHAAGRKRKMPRGPGTASPVMRWRLPARVRTNWGNTINPPEGSGFT